MKIDSASYGRLQNYLHQWFFEAHYFIKTYISRCEVNSYNWHSSAPNQTKKSAYENGCYFFLFQIELKFGVIATMKLKLHRESVRKSASLKFEFQCTFYKSSLSFHSIKRSSLARHFKQLSRKHFTLGLSYAPMNKSGRIGRPKQWISNETRRTSLKNRPLIRIYSKLSIKNNECSQKFIIALLCRVLALQISCSL